MINFAQTADFQRRISNIIRAGLVHSVDLTNARCRVSIGDILTAPIPFISCKAGYDSTWHPPEVGEQVIVLSPSGELSAGFVLGGIYTNNHPAPSTSSEVTKMLFKDGSTAIYDRALHSLTIDLPSTNSGLSITVNGNTTIHSTGNTLVEAVGNATVSAGAVARVEAGTSIDMVAPVINVTSTVIVSGDVTAGGKSLKSHKHSDPQGGQTSTPI